LNEIGEISSIPNPGKRERAHSGKESVREIDRERESARARARARASEREREMEAGRQEEKSALSCAYRQIIPFSC
jgi:hypothetical protein